MTGEEYVRRMQEREAAEAAAAPQGLSGALVREVEAVLRRSHCPHGGCLQPHPEWKLVVAERVAAELTS